MENLSKEAFLEWKSLNVSKYLLNLVMYNREQIKEELAQGRGGDFAAMQKLVGECHSLQTVIGYLANGFGFDEEEETSEKESMDSGRS